MAHPRSSSDHAGADAAAVDGSPENPFAGLRPPPVSVAERLVGLVRDQLPVSVGRSLTVAVVVVVSAAVGWWFLRPAAPPVESAIPLAVAAGSTSADPAVAAGGGAGAAGSTTTEATTEVVVQAAGAVGRPGVYRLPAASRVDDLVRRAGGLAADADPDRVNLAAPVADGERVWVPHRGEERPPEVVAGTGSGAPSTLGGGATAPAGPRMVDLNSASADELDTLPGVGPATAAAILAYRDEHGRFSSVDELLEVRGIGDAKLEQLRSLVTV